MHMRQGDQISAPRVVDAGNIVEHSWQQKQSFNSRCTIAGLENVKGWIIYNTEFANYQIQWLRVFFLFHVICVYWLLLMA